MTSRIAEGRIFDRATLERAEQELKRQYLSRGKCGVTITTTVTPLERNRVGINFDVAEGDTANDQANQYCRRQCFRDKDLIDLFQSCTPNWISRYTKRSILPPETGCRSLRLCAGVLDRGFEFNTSRPRFHFT